MKIGIFSDALRQDTADSITRLGQVGENTGNLIFFRAIDRLFRPRFISPELARPECAEEFYDCDAFLTTELIWVREGEDFPSLERTLSLIGDRPLIPVSVGLQADVGRSDFFLSPRTLRLLSALSERCVIGTRGSYTAEVLSSHGVKRLRPIGCPSVFYKHRYRFPKPQADPKTVCGFSTLWRDLRENELTLLRYFMRYDLPLVEQTGLYSFAQHAEFDAWLTARRRLFLSTAEWDRFLSEFDFYLGMRFHGGIAAMQKGLRALFITSDSRTAELCEFFRLPSIPLCEFDPATSPSQYMHAASPHRFLQALPALEENLKEFALENGLTIRI